MQCDEIQLDLTAYLYGGLPPDQRAEIERHLSTCQACSEEAAAMRDIGRKLSRGLKEWVDEGVCPPEVLARIEESFRPTRSRAWWQRWPAYAGAVAAVLLILVVVASRTVDFSYQMASIPLVGTLATQLLYPNADVQVHDLTSERPAQVITSAEKDGIVLAVHQATLGADSLQIQYSLKGPALDTQANISRYAAELTGPKGALKLRRLRIVRTDGEVLLTAEYDPTLPGQTLSLTVNDLPTVQNQTAPQAGAVWQVSVKP